MSEKIYIVNNKDKINERQKKKKIKQEKVFQEKEKNLITTKILTAEELQDIVYQGHFLPKDKRFLDIEDGGVFEYFTPRIFGKRNFKNCVFPVVKKGDLIVGLAQIERPPLEEQENVVWVKFISIDPRYQNKGYASKLLDSIFRYARDNSLVLEISAYSPSGWEKLRKKNKKLAKKYGVKIIDKEEKNF